MKRIKSKTLLCILTLVSILLLAILIMMLFCKSSGMEPRIGSSQSEIEYLLVEVLEDSSNCSDFYTIDSVLIDGGVIKVVLSEHYLHNVKLVSKDTDEAFDEADCLYAIIDYIGVFGWELQIINDDLLYFIRQ